MNESFKKEVKYIDYIVISACIVMLIAANFIYGATQKAWITTSVIVGLLILIMLFEPIRIKCKSRDHDERAQYIEHRALAVGFYFMFLVVFWYFVKELALDGHVSTRAYVEIFSGVVGYLGSLVVLRKFY